MIRLASFFLVVFFLNTAAIFALDIQDALLKKQVQLHLLSNGLSLKEGMITAKIKNTSIQKLDLKFPVGTHLKSDDPGLQDLIVVKEQILVLQPNQTWEQPLVGMCIQKSNQSPGDGNLYHLADVIQGPMKTCAERIARDQIFNGCGQDAMWALSDGQDIGWIETENDQEKGLRQLVADLKGVENPWYTTAHETNNNQLADNFDPMQPTDAYMTLGSAQINGDFVWTQAQKKQLSFAIYDENGNIVRKFFEGKEFGEGEYTFRFHYKTSENLRGQYYARISDGDEIVREAVFTF
jgi:hypothetical protein